MEYCQIFNLLQNLLHSVAVLIERLLVSLKVVSVEGALQEFLVAFKPEIALSRPYGNLQQHFEFLPQIAADEFPAILYFLFGVAIPRVISPFHL